MAISVSKKELKRTVKESVREVINQELMKFRSLLLPYVSQREQREIEKLYGEPFRRTAKTLKIKL